MKPLTSNLKNSTMNGKCFLDLFPNFHVHGYSDKGYLLKRMLP